MRGCLRVSHVNDRDLLTSFGSLVSLQIIDFFQTGHALGPEAAAGSCQISLGLRRLQLVHLLLKTLHVRLQPICGLGQTADKEQ